MSTINIQYDDQQVSVELIRPNETVQYIYIDKHTDFEDIATQICDLLDRVAGSCDVNLEDLNDCN